MRYKFEAFSKNKMDTLYLTESMITEWLQTIDELCYEVDKTYSSGFDLWTHWLFQYYNELNLGEAIESVHLMWKSEQHRLTPKYDILYSFVSIVTHCHVTYEEDDKPFIIFCQCCNAFVRSSVRI